MLSPRQAVAAIALLAAYGWAATVPAHAASRFATPVSGVTKDGAGNALAGVEVLLLSDAKGGQALLRTLSDERGRFVLGSLDPGIYRIAAIKTGYVAALGRVNTLLRSTVDLVLRPMPKPGEPGSDQVLDDLSWTLRVPPRGILRQTDPTVLLASRETGGATPIAAQIEDSLRGEVDHAVAMGSWRPTSDGSAPLQGMETAMRIGGNIGERGAIQVKGRRGSLDSSTRGPGGSMARDASDVDVGFSYDTSDDTRLAMNAFYSRGDLAVGGGGDGALPAGPAARQGQRSWGYDASWKKQMDASSRLAVQVGYHDASLDVADTAADLWPTSVRDASNRAIAASGSYESLAGDGHLLRVGLRAQRLFLSTPDAHFGQAADAFPVVGSEGWSVLMDGEDQWSLSAPWALTYGVAVRQSYDGRSETLLSPRVGGTWTAPHLKAHAEVSYLSTAGTGAAAARTTSPTWSPVGYDVLVETPVSPTAVVRGSATYTPLRAESWSDGTATPGATDIYVTDGIASDQNVALAIERAATSVAVSFRVAHGRAEGILAPALDAELPIVVLNDGSLTYDSARLATNAARSGTAVALEYRSTREDVAAWADPMQGAPLRTVELSITQELVRLGAGRATCRLLLSGRTVVDPSLPAADTAAEAARRFAASHERYLAGLQLSF
ncbi:MAG TPA: carboxypeptidase-like regulatory domain-containing protein [Candidatus Sulfotelmatobacter sp.]|jgi:hypothetical protein|nr:carboxypeptidase-like regulatory domain-containing protein [Candidatus Sulfotelmatobacter sp.]